MKVIDQTIKDEYAIYNGDCIDVVKDIPDNSIHYTLFSPPFSSLFTYSNSNRDMGNSKSDKEFYEHFKLVLPDLFRITMPGRLLTFHCANMPAMKEKDGFIGIKDFRGDLIKLFQEVDFIFHSEVCIWKDPLIEATRTKALGLMHKQICKDSNMAKQGTPDYLITMRKPGINPEPIKRKRGFEEYAGEMKVPKDKKNDNPKLNKFSHKIWQRYASPVWFDIRQTNTLNCQLAREDKDERHICPLQLDTIQRCLDLWSTKGDTILSPFGGIGSEGYQALLMGRKSISIELKESYYALNVKNHFRALKQRKKNLIKNI